MNYFFTGKLGSGKSLCAVGRIRDYLHRGRTVATNLDLYPAQLVGRDAKETRIIRLPDKPSSADLEMIGEVNPTTDEDLNGLLVLDECGTWFNSRTWGDKERQPVIDWLLHARKFGWDIIFLVQDISMVDKQAREGLAEMVGYCKRLDRLPVPLIGKAVSVLSSGFFTLHLPRVHICAVKYGYSPNSLSLDPFIYRGTDLYTAYDTKQIFRDRPPYHRRYIRGGASGAFSYLPPYAVSGRYRYPKTWGNIMRITKIIGRKYSRVFSALMGAAAVLVLAFGLWLHTAPQVVQAVESAPALDQQQEDVFLSRLSSFRLMSVSRYPGRLSFVISDGKDKISSASLSARGYNFKEVGKNAFLISNGSAAVSVYR